MRDYLLVTFIVVMVVIYLVALPLAKNKAKKLHQAQVTQFQESLAPGDSVMMAAGIIGTVIKIKPETILLEIAAKTVIEIDKMAVVGKL